MRPLFFKVLPQYSACSIYERNKQVAGVFFAKEKNAITFRWQGQGWRQRM